MPLFKYQAITATGKTSTGTLDADDHKTAREHLRSQGLMATKLSICSKKLFKRQLEGEHLVNFTLQLAQLLIAGIPLYESLIALEEEYQNEEFAKVIATLSVAVRRGERLSQSMALYPNSFNPLYCAMVAAGESTGTLGIVLKKLGTHLSKQLKLKKQILTALIYPGVLAGFATLVVILLFTFVVPSLEAIFAEQKVNGFTAFVISLSHFMTGYWWLYLPLTALSIAGAIMALRTPRGRLAARQCIQKLPIFKKLTVQTALARFSRTMATLQEGGLALVDALQIAKPIITHSELERVISQATHKIIAGSSLSRELRAAPEIPSLVSRMIAIGEESGTLTEMWYRIADIYDEDVEKNLTRMTNLAQPLILVIMGGVVGMVMLAVLLPLTDISAFIGR